MSRGKKWGVAITLLVFAVAAGLSGWFLSRYDPETASQYAALIQAVTAVFSLSAVVFAVMAIAAPSGAAGPVQKNRAGAGGVVIAAQGGNVYTSGHEHGRAAGADNEGASGDQTAS